MYIAFIECYAASEVFNSMEEAVENLINVQCLDDGDIEKIQIAEVLQTKVRLPTSKFWLE